MASYSEALAVLPDNYRLKSRSTVHEIFFGGRLILANGEDKPVVFENGAWREFNA